ncbi:MAG TPA: M14 family zinc carboxypeptidase [Candidatus Limnocylindrales bacterium]|nr:M14 family zinc carboxypeptidase [Candidatus Limnocylindrales bacterium]
MRPSLRRPSSRVPVLVGLVAALAGSLAAPATAAAAEPDFPSNMSGYHNLPEMTAEIFKAEADYPELVDVFSIGKSYQGRDIWMAKVSDNVGTDEAEPEVLIDALHHAREHLTTEQALAVLRWLTREYASNDTIRGLVNGREVFIIFALNPDGMRYDLTGDPFRAWRKNRQPNAGTTAVGTDLNRNYGYRWGCCGGSSGSPSSITYRGPAAWSAPEVRALRDFVRSRVIGGVQQIRTHVTLHTNGQLILYPYGYTRTNVPSDMTYLDYTAFRAIGASMASRNGYVLQQSSDLYITDGDQIDWMYGEHRIFSYTFELYPPETSTVWGDHYPDDSRIATQTARNRSAILHLIGRASCPYASLGADALRRDCGPLFDDLEINRGWSRDPDGTDTAVTGRWSVANPASTSSSGAKQLGKTWSGSKALVTGSAAGTSANANDVDGTTTIRSRPIRLPASAASFGSLTFRAYLAHGANSSPDDALRVSIEAEDGTRTVVFEELGAAEDDDAAWTSVGRSLAPFAGQTIRLVVEAVDGGEDSLVEAALDDIRIRRP